MPLLCSASPITRRLFVISTGQAALGALLTPAMQAQAASTSAPGQEFTWRAGQLQFNFSVAGQLLRQHAFLPHDLQVAPERVRNWAGVETAIQCSGEDSPDSGMKQSGGAPGTTLRFTGQHEEKTATGSRLILEQTAPDSGLVVRSVYESFHNLPVVRRHVEVSNGGTKAIGIDYLSSAMLHGLADPMHYDHELKIWLAYNSWMAEGQWHSYRPSELGFVENERTSWSQASATSVGSWSTEKYLPMSVVENHALGVAWFWQIEHNGSWHWEVSNLASGSNHANDVYAYLGGPDELHANAWKNLAPGATYRTVPVAIGCVRGGFTEAVQALTAYRQQVCIRPRPTQTLKHPVIFNDYMNCLWGDPTEAKELPLIDAAARAGCEYFVIDAGWYVDAGQSWSKGLGTWEDSKTRWPHGIKFVLDYIRGKKMVPGIWLEPEVAGVGSELSHKPNSWFLMRHGERVEKNERLLLDFRNPEVTAYLNRAIQHLVVDWGIGYIKMDYNTDTLAGTDQAAESVGQGLLEHNRAVLAWLDGLLDRYPKLVIENCGSGGGRMDYAMLSHTQIQSCTDQEQYYRLPAIATGASAGVAASQLAMWSYPKQADTADAASFNMVTGMLLRIHQSGHLQELSPAAAAQVQNGIAVYKQTIRDGLETALPFYPLGMPDVTNQRDPVALGMTMASHSFIAVWRLEGEADVQVPLPPGVSGADILYPTDLGITTRPGERRLIVSFPRQRMGCILQLRTRST